MNALPIFQFHPVSGIFPLLEGLAFDRLVADISENGLREPIWIHRDQRIIDGRNRARACDTLGLKPSTRLFEGQDSELVAFVVSLNLHRRHLDESQRAMVAANIANMRSGARTDLKPAASLPEVSQADAAKLLNVSERSVRKARKVRKKADPVIVDAVEKGKMSVSAAEKATKLSKAEQRERVKLPKPAEARKIARETGEPTLGSDGIYHSGKSAEDLKAEKEKNERIFKLVNAMEAVSSLALEVTPAQYIEQLPPHLRGTLTNAFDAAWPWLAAFASSWRGSDE